MVIREEQQRDIPHHVVIEARTRMSVTGVLGVDSFDEQKIESKTTRGVLIIKGHGLHIDKLSVESGDMLISGEIDALQYEAREEQKGGLFSRLFR